MKNVKDKTVLVTGAAMGLGKLFARKAVEQGAAAVVLWDINEQVLQETADEPAAAGGTVHPYIVDVSSADAIANAAQMVREDVGTVEILLNNAGIVRGNQYFWETEDVSAIQQTMAINALAPMFITREFLPGMIELDTDCRIVNIASSAGLVANPRMAVYAASKWAAVGWSDSVRLELSRPSTHTHQDHHRLPHVHQHRDVRRRQRHLPDAHAGAGGGRRRHLEGDAQGRAVPDHPVDLTPEQDPHRNPAGQRARLLPRPRRGVSLDGRILRPRRTCEVVAGSPSSGDARLQPLQNVGEDLGLLGFVVRLVVHTFVLDEGDLAGHPDR